MTSQMTYTAAEETIIVSPITVAEVDEMFERMTAAGFDNVNEYVDYMISLHTGEVHDYTDQHQPHAVGELESTRPFYF